MSNDACARTLPLLPEWIRGELEGSEAGRVEAHVEACEACGAEAALLRALARTRAEPPPELAGRIKGALRTAGASTERAGSWPALVPRVAAAAAVLVLAATVVLLPGGGEGDGAGGGPELAMDAVPEVWLSDDGMVAGAPLLAELSEEELATLLEEMEP